MTLLRPLCLILPLCLAACALVDQRTFDATAGRKPVPAVVAGPPLPVVPALMTIRYSVANPDYHDVLEKAVRRALARKPDVLFTVSTLIPAIGGVDSEASAAASGREVAQAIVAAGAQPGQVERETGSGHRMWWQMWRSG
jgi:hypothetical protein